jgi:hypothetical protein
VPKRGGIELMRESVVPKRGGVSLRREGVLPEREGVALRRGDAVPKREGVALRRGGVVPKRGGVSLRRKGVVPRREGVVPKRGGMVLKRGGVSLRRGGVVPKTDDLPALPEGSTAVSSENDATALLGALADVSQSINSAIWTAIAGELGSEEATDKAYDISDVTGNNVKVTAKGRGMTFPESFEVNDTVKGTQEWTRQVVVTADTIADGSTVVQGGSFGREWTSVIDMKATVAGDRGTAKFTGTLSSTERYVYGLTAKGAGEKSARIILDAAMEASGTFTDKTADQGQASMTKTYSGSLKVYGAGAEPVYTLLITNEATYQEALGYFGIGDEQD